MHWLTSVLGLVAVGGAGADTLIAGAGDVLAGVAGADQFAAGSWTVAEATVQLMDYNAGEDQLVLVRNFDGGAELLVEVQQSPDAEGEQLILADGASAMQLSGAGGLTAADLVLIDSTSAAAAGLLPQ